MHNNFTIKTNYFTILFMKSISGELAKSIIDLNKYMTLATSDACGVPWAAPVCYKRDPLNNFYFASNPKSRHILNTKNNKMVAFAIFDSTIPEGKGVGVQGRGTIKKLGAFELLRVVQYYISPFLAADPALFKGKSFYRLYKLTPHELWVTDDDCAVDRRVPVLIPRHNPDPRCI